jgi:hypothetical protein
MCGYRLLVTGRVLPANVYFFQYVGSLIRHERLMVVLIARRVDGRAATPVFAHHSFRRAVDSNKPITLEGMVTKAWLPRLHG